MSAFANRRRFFLAFVFQSPRSSLLASPLCQTARRGSAPPRPDGCALNAILRLSRGLTPPRCSQDKAVATAAEAAKPTAELLATQTKVTSFAESDTLTIPASRIASRIASCLCLSATSPFRRCRCLFLSFHASLGPLLASSPWVCPARRLRSARFAVSLSLDTTSLFPGKGQVGSLWLARRVAGSHGQGREGSQGQGSFETTSPSSPSL